jgi:GTP-binding protein
VTTPAPQAAAPDGLSPEEAARIEAGRLLFARPVRFFFAAQKLEGLPPTDAPEVAFCGRSNVGKSSLINALAGHHGLARVSHTPGRTRQLNFFAAGEDNGPRLTLVDMPGYGFAAASKAVKADWQGLMFDYLRGRPTLRRVILLMDARIETKDGDRAAMDLLGEAAVPFQIVLTKADDTKPASRLLKRQEEMAEIVRKRVAAHPVVLTTSSAKGTGIPELRAALAEIAAAG